jgi:uncharacterized protein YbdZ (MbtH family)
MGFEVSASGEACVNYIGCKFDDLNSYGLHQLAEACRGNPDASCIKYIDSKIDDLNI